MTTTTKTTKAGADDKSVAVAVAVAQDIRTHRHLIYLYRPESEQPACTQSWRGLPLVRNVFSKQCRTNELGCLDDDGEPLLVGPQSHSDWTNECGRFVFVPDQHAPSPNAAGTLLLVSYYPMVLHCGVMTGPSRRIGCWPTTQDLAPDVLMATQGTELVWRSAETAGPGLRSAAFVRSWAAFEDKEVMGGERAVHAVERAMAPPGAVEYALRFVPLGG
ncbi:MAG: hypothetical protein M1826_003523 [Phylliscum demangeonii]|nr:MAG: hypothetical protein M1826_003523 [Phylliscum demangeonii]